MNKQSNGFPQLGPIISGVLGIAVLFSCGGISQRTSDAQVELSKIELQNDQIDESITEYQGKLNEAKINLGIVTTTLPPPTTQPPATQAPVTQPQPVATAPSSNSSGASPELARACDATRALLSWAESQPTYDPFDTGIQVRHVAELFAAAGRSSTAEMMDAQATLYVAFGGLGAMPGMPAKVLARECS